MAHLHCVSQLSQVPQKQYIIVFAVLMHQDTGAVCSADYSSQRLKKGITTIQNQGTMPRQPDMIAKQQTFYSLSLHESYLQFCGVCFLSCVDHSSTQVVNLL